jgi:uncharacterized protein YlzI (FlbEa/FlbD family)
MQTDDNRLGDLLAPFDLFATVTVTPMTGKQWIAKETAQDVVQKHYGTSFCVKDVKELINQEHRFGLIFHSLRSLVPHPGSQTRMLAFAQSTEALCLIAIPPNKATLMEGNKHVFSHWLVHLQNQLLQQPLPRHWNTIAITYPHLITSSV